MAISRLCHSRAFNEDKPYDRFLQEQIAGDVLWPDNEQAVIATGFLAAGPWDFVGQVETKSPVLRRSARSLDLDDMATQVMTATMAMTINCARCHDHKLDPISQREYYQLRAVFAGVKREDRVVSDAALKQYEVQQQELVAQRNRLDFEKGRLEGEGLNLADIVGGGNGLGTGTYRKAIDPRNAKLQTRRLRQPWQCGDKHVFAVSVSSSSMACSYPTETTARRRYPSVRRALPSQVCQRHQARRGT